MGKVRPFESVKHLMIEFVNEVFFVVILYHLICFTDIVADTRARVNSGYSCIAFTSMIIFFNFLIMLGGIAHTVKLYIKRY